MNYDTWIDTFIAEKGIDRDQTITVDGAIGQNIMPLGTVIDATKQAPASERSAILKTLSLIDVKNGDPVHFLRHLAQAIAI